MLNLRRIWSSRKKSETPPVGIKETGRIKSIQVALMRVGFPVRLSGVMDPVTRNGIRSFQRGNGLPETGFLDRETVDLLKAKVKERKRAPGRWDPDRTLRRENIDSNGDDRSPKPKKETEKC